MALKDPLGEDERKEEEDEGRRGEPVKGGYNEGTRASFLLSKVDHFSSLKADFFICHFNNSGVCSPAQVCQLRDPVKGLPDRCSTRLGGLQKDGDGGLGLVERSL